MEEKEGIKNFSSQSLKQPETSNGIGTVGANFTPHMVIVNPGEDVMMKIKRFSQQKSFYISILSAIGFISRVTIGQSMAPGGTRTFEGRFEILSLNGTYLVENAGRFRCTSGGMSVSLARPDGHVFGGRLSDDPGRFIAAGRVEVMVGTFNANHDKKELGSKKRKLNSPKKTEAGSNNAFGPIKM